MNGEQKGGPATEIKLGPLDNIEKKRCFERAFLALLSPVLSNEDTPNVTNTKKLIVPAAFLLLVNQLVHVLVRVVVGNWFASALSLTRVVLMSGFLSYVVLTKKIPLVLLEVTLISVGVLFLCGDMIGYGLEDVWTFIILVMDSLLLTGCRTKAGVLVSCLTVAFLVLKTVEEGIGLGIYDAIPVALVEDGVEPNEPRSITWTFNCIVIRILVFVLDFLMTRRFAVGMREEQAKTQKRVLLAQDVAAALARFDLDAADKLVGFENGDELCDAFRGLLQNLRLYRPYLPDALFDIRPKGRHSHHPLESRFNTENHRGRQTPPGSDSGTVAIAFTDIQASTDLWETCTEAMRFALQTHNTTVRTILAQENGYEVKTIGDAFMVAFDTALDAVAFSLQVQEALVVATWPTPLLEHPLCKEVRTGDTVTWKGLRVRIGIHSGPVRLEVNPTTGRTDYLGRVVNKASRVESAAIGGSIAFTEDVHSAIQTSLLQLGQPTITDMGEVNLKGVGNVQLYCCVPLSLSSRIFDIEAKLPTSTMEELGEVQDNMPKITLVKASSSGLTRNELTASMSTIVHLNVNLERLTAFPRAVDGMSRLLDIVLGGIDRFDALVVSVCSNSIVASWNAGKACSLHVVQSANMVAHLKRQVKTTPWDKSLSTGVATARTLHGTLGNSRQRFVTAAGSAIELSRALAESASQLKVFCLLSGERSAATDLVMKVHTRPVDVWFLGLDAKRHIVFEFNLRSYAQVDGVWNIFDGLVRGSWSDEYKRAFDTKDIVALKQLSLEDPTVERIVEIMEGRLVLRRPFASGLRIEEKADGVWV